MVAYNLRYIYLAVFVCLNIVKAYFPDLIPDFDTDFLLPVWAMGATYYFSNSGNDSTGNGSATNPWKTVGKYNTEAAGHSGANTYKFKRGDLFDDAPLTNQKSSSTFGAWYNADGTDDTTKAEPIFDGTALSDNVFAIPKSATVSDVDVINAPTGKAGIYLSGSENISLTRISARDCPRGIDTWVSGGTITIDKYMSINNGAAGGYADVFTALSGSFAISDYIVNPNLSFPAGTANNGVLINGPTNLYNSVLGGAVGTVLTVGNAATVNVINSVLFASLYGGNYTIYHDADVTLNIGNSVVMQNWATRAVSFRTYNDLGGNVTPITSPMRFMRHQRSGYFLPCVDDPNDEAPTSGTPGNYVLGPKMQYLLDLVALWQSKGVRGTIFMRGINLAYGSYDYLSYFQALADTGVIDMAIHGYTHVPLDTTTAGTITKGAETFTINRTADTITTSDSSVTVAAFRAKTMKQITDAFTAGGWTVSLEAAFGDNDGLYNHGEILDDGTAVNDLLLLIDTTNTGENITGFFKDQVWDWKVWLEANLTGVSITTVGGPGGLSSADSETAIKNMGFIANRNWLSTDTVELESINIYKTSVRQSETIRNDNAAEDTTAVAEWMAQKGTLLHFNSHASTDTTLAAWAIILDTFAKYPEIKVMGFAQAANEVRTTPWTTADDITYTRTFTDASDYRMKSGSPAINAGTDVGLTTDFLGKPIRGVPDIGAYEYYGATGNFGFGFGMGF